MEQAGEVDYLITWRDTEFVGRVSLTPCRPTAVRLAGLMAAPESSDHADDRSLPCLAVNPLSDDVRVAIVAGVFPDELV